MKRLHVMLAVLGLLLISSVLPQFRGAVSALAQQVGGKKTVAARLNQYGPAARSRLQPYFSSYGVSYPPKHLVLVGIKDERRLEIYADAGGEHFQFIHSYPILAASGTLGPKLKEGDGQVPEGIYKIESLNPNSQFHLSLRINYPNEFDRQQARLEGRSGLGGDIMIHGAAVSIGCLAMGDEAAEDLFVLAADTGLESIFVILTPVDFRQGKTVSKKIQKTPWTDSLYETIKTKLSGLPKPKPQ